MKAIFLDRDGTVDAGIPKYPRVDSVDKVEILPTVIEALRLLSSLDYAVCYCDEPNCIAEGIITDEQLG